jgi:hypothetical protein
VLGGKLEVALVVDGQSRMTSSVQVTGHDQMQSMIVVIAERAEGIVPDIRAAVATVDPFTGIEPFIVTLTPDALPRRVEAWTAIDRLVWQDVDAAQLDADQLAALEGWVAAGGHLVIAGGTTGIGTLAAFPDSILPFRPTRTVDVQPAALQDVLGTLPAGATPLPALEGTLARGSVLARSPDGVVAAQTRIGTGNATLLGFDPGAAWLKGSAAAQNVWRRTIPTGGAMAMNPIAVADDNQIVGALQAHLPAVDLPPIDQLFLLLLGYIALVGPINYLVLRRLDRREWAWVTMPVLVALFAIAAYLLGASLKGSDVIINQVAIVRAGQGTDRGIGQVYVGLFSPARAKYEVSVSGGALLSNPIYQLRAGAVEQPLDVLMGDPSRLRDYQVGFGQLRGFRAETSVTTPTIRSDLRLDAGRLKGTVTNGSGVALEAGAIVYGSGVAIIGSMAPGATHSVDIAVSDPTQFQTSLSARLYGAEYTADPAVARQLNTRRAVIDQLTLYTQKGIGTTSLGDGPTLVAWHPAPALDVEVGDPKVTRVGETLFLTPLDVTATGRAIFAADLMQRTVLASDAAQAMDQGVAFELGRGTLSMEYRPAGFQGSMRADRLVLSLTDPGEPNTPGDPTRTVAPLPAAQQPPQDDPVGTATGVPRPADRAVMPAIQLFDRVDRRWVEFAKLDVRARVAVEQPERYVDAGGSVLIRFVNREEQTYFNLFVSVEGAVA